MARSHIWFGLVVLGGASLAGDYLCHTLADAGDQQRLLDSAAKGVEALPTSFGRWQRVREEPLTETAQRLLRCRAHQSCVYIDKETGDNILLTLLAGSSGPMVAHTPEVCYSSTDFDIDERPRADIVRQTGTESDTFGRVAFRSKSLAGQRQYVFYAWRKRDGRWEAPQSPRLALAGEPMLYKLQLAIVGQDSIADKDYAVQVVHRFLSDLLPVLDEILKVR